MARRKHKKQHKTGKPPGSLIYTGPKREGRVRLQLIEFDESHLQVEETATLDQLKNAAKSDLVSWVHIQGLHQPEIIGQIGEIFGLHTLLLEDILNIDHRPGYYEDDKVLVAIIKMLTPDTDDAFTQTEQVSVVCGDKFVLSFQELGADVFAQVKERLVRPTTKIRSRQADYLAYSLLDTIVDQYLYTIDEFGERVEWLEDELIRDRNPQLLEHIYTYKRELNFLRKIIRPVREIALQFQKSEADWVQETTDPFLKDLADHAEYAAESVETYRETINDLLSFYHTQAAGKLNDILRVLTVVSVVFLPLNFLAGMYGTNFEFIPGLHAVNAWPVFLLVQAVIALMLIWYFRRRRWL